MWLIRAALRRPIYINGIESVESKSIQNIGLLKLTPVRPAGS
jgi:hypothetical protein